MPGVPVRPLRSDHKTEILVVGAGISGALVAEALSADGHEVTIVDRRGPARGSTPASTALVEYEIDTPLIELARKTGTYRAARAWQRSRLAVDAIAARTRELDIRCDMARRDSLYLAGDVLDRDGIEREVEVRRAAGLETLFLTGKALRERFGIRRAAALLAYDDLVLDPRRLTAGYLKAAAKRGARVCTPVDIVTVESGKRSHVAETRGGPTISCRYLVFATGYEFPKFVPLKGHRIISTYAIATRPQRRRLWPEECLIWEASDPYLYMRTTADGRVICGGEDEDFSDDEMRDALIPKKIAAIRRKLERLLPKLDTAPDFAWAGAFGTSDTGLPLIGEVPRRPGCFAVLGFGGNGITYSRIAADIIRAAIDGKEDPDAGLYAFA
jgi:glycine/D-amino acid oxidase-like deaminating enzyme